MRQAEDDATTADRLVELGIHYAACFFYQQASEKALKAYLFSRGVEPPRVHSVGQLFDVVRELGGPDLAVTDDVRFIDQYYIPTRYPDALPSGVPSDTYGAGDSARAGAAAGAVLEAVRSHLAT